MTTATPMPSDTERVALTEGKTTSNITV